MLFPSKAIIACAHYGLLRYYASGLLFYERNPVKSSLLADRAVAYEA